MDTEEFERAIFYRRAYGLTRQRLDLKHSCGPERRDHAALLAKLIHDVKREMGSSAGQSLEAIDQGVEDAVKGLHPAW